MATTWNKTAYPGVRYREHPTRKTRNGQPDRYFTIRSKKDGKLLEEALGWASEGWNAEKAYTILSSIKSGLRTGDGPKSLAEKREQAAERKKQEQEAARVQEMASMPMRVFFEQYYIPRAKKEKRSWLTDKQRIDKLINAAVGDYPLQALKKEKLQEWVNTMSETMAPATVKQYLGIVKRAYNIAREVMIEDVPVFTGVNPCTGVVLPVVRNARDRFFTVEEVDSILKAANELPSPDLHDCCALSLNTGLRLGELRRLFWSDVDLTHNIVTVRDEAQRKPGGKVPLNEEATEIFKKRKKLRSGDHPLVFPPIKGDETRANLSHLFTKLVDSIGLNKGIALDDRQRRVVFHTFRHTFASWLALAGTDIYVIKELMRHRTIQMTMRYAHLSPGVTHSAVANLRPKIEQTVKMKQK